MNSRQGFRRVWMALSVLWFLVVVGVTSQQLWLEFTGPQILGTRTSGGEIAIPGICALAKGTSFWREDALSGDAGICWWRMSAFRQEYPMYNDSTDFQLAEATYKKAHRGEVRQSSPWLMTGVTVVWILLPPLMLGAIFILVGWVVSGFRQPPDINAKVQPTGMSPASIATER